MPRLLRRLTLVLLVSGCGCSATVASAASPDGGTGAWADQVAAVSQGQMATGAPVKAARSTAGSALGIAEKDFIDDHFFSMGVGGRIVLGFENSVCNGPGPDLELWETTREPYPDEKVDVFASDDGSNFTLVASSVNKDASVDLPPSVTSARYVGLVDVTDPRSTPGADGYDLDGVRALSTGCGAPGVPPRSNPTEPPSSTEQSTSLSEAPLTPDQRLPGRAFSTCRVPALKGVTLGGARRVLKRAGCQSGRIVRRYSRRFRRGRVVNTGWRAGTRHPWQSRVALIVSRGARRTPR